MTLKNIFWSGVKKIVSHHKFSPIFHRSFPFIQNPSLNQALKKAIAYNISETYPELSLHQKEKKESPIFVTARFRSGSTLLWNIFRNIDGTHSYYEPLNERRWFDKERRQNFVDKSHKGVTDYWSEYDHITNVNGLFSNNWTFKRLAMDASSFDPNLLAYIEALIHQAPVRPVLQFNRVDFRLPWLRANFKNAKIIHLYRHPRDQWISVSRYSTPVPHDLSGHDLASYNLFYTIEWVRDLTSTFPFLDPSLGKHPYYYHYLLWRLSYAYGKAYSDISVSFEELVTDPTSTLPRIFNCIGINRVDLDSSIKCINNQKLGRWKEYANDEWYRAVESECEDLLQVYFTGEECDFDSSKQHAMIDIK